MYFHIFYFWNFTFVHKFMVMLGQASFFVFSGKDLFCFKTNFLVYGLQ